MPQGKERGESSPCFWGLVPREGRGKAREVAGQTDGSRTFCQASWERGYDHDRGAGIKSNQLWDQQAVRPVSC